MTQAIEFHATRKHFGELLALDGIECGIPQGQVTGLLGHNGAGKSTLIKLILGLIKADGGSVSVLGEAPWQNSELRRRIGYLPENAHFYANLTGRESLSFYARLKRADAAQVDQLLERVGLTHAARRRVGTWSKGMRQRLGLAQALLGQPELVLLDEPTTGLDPDATRELYRLIAELRAEGVTLLVCSHLLTELEPHIDGAMILQRGRLLVSGNMLELTQLAELPAQLLVRLAPGSRYDASTLSGATVETLADGRLHLAVAQADKLALLRLLLANPAVTDVDVRPPSLAQLYDHLGQSPAGSAS